MESAPQRATIVLEHASATLDFDDEDQIDGKPWSVVAYLISDSGERERITLHRCRTRAEAGEALSRIWSDFKERRPFLVSAA
jgi:hypothetical protein